MTPHWYDTHFHLDETHPETAHSILEGSRAAQVMQFLLQATSPDDCQFVLDVAQKEEGTLAAIGQHPLDIEKFTSIDMFREYAKQPRVAAIGEIGLDYHYAPETAEKQKAAFAQFLDLAVELALPAVVHCRDSFQDCYDIVSSHCPTGYPMVIHSFTGTPQEAAAWIQRGCYLSVNGMVTFKKAENIRQILSLIPEDRLLLETDSPYLAPVPLRGTVNTPATIPIIGTKVAELRNLPVEQLAQLTTDNANRLFG